MPRQRMGRGSAERTRAHRSMFTIVYCCKGDAMMTWALALFAFESIWVIQRMLTMAIAQRLKGHLQRAQRTIAAPATLRKTETLSRQISSPPHVLGLIFVTKIVHKACDQLTTLNRRNFQD